MRLTAKVMRAFTAKHDRSPNDQEVYDLIHAKMTPTGSAGSQYMTLKILGSVGVSLAKNTTHSTLTIHQTKTRKTRIL